MSATTDYILPKWVAKTPLFEMLVRVVDPKHNPATDFHDEFEIGDDTELRPRIGANLKHAISYDFELLLKAIDVPYLRDFGEDWSEQESAGAVFVTKDQTIDWGSNNFSLTPQELLDISAGVGDAESWVEQAKIALQDQDLMSSILDVEQVPDSFSLEALPEKLEAFDESDFTSLAKVWRQVIDIKLQNNLEPEGEPSKPKMKR